MLRAAYEGLQASREQLKCQHEVEVAQLRQERQGPQERLDAQGCAASSVTPHSSYGNDQLAARRSLGIVCPKLQILLLDYVCGRASGVVDDE